MTPSELKRLTAETSPYFFTRNAMKSFGDSMKNYGVCSNIVETPTRKSVAVWELYRKRPVKYGNQSSAYFCKSTFKRIHRKIN